jgi:hypothetical protein
MYHVGEKVLMKKELKNGTFVALVRRFGTILLLLFNKHPNENKETYLEHLYFAVTMSFIFVGASVFFFLHGFLPFIKIPNPFNLISIKDKLNFIYIKRTIK